MAKQTARRSKRRVASRSKTLRSKTRRRKTTRAKSARRAGKRKVASRRKTAKRATAKRPLRKLTTAEAMHKALEMKQAAEHSRLPVQQTWPTQMPSSVEPDPIPENLREQGNVANIIQNTSNRRAG